MLVSFWPVGKAIQITVERKLIAITISKQKVAREKAAGSDESRRDEGTHFLLSENSGSRMSYKQNPALVTQKAGLMNFFSNKEQKRGLKYVMRHHKIFQEAKKDEYARKQYVLPWIDT